MGRPVHCIPYDHAGCELSVQKKILCSRFPQKTIFLKTLAGPEFQLPPENLYSQAFRV